MKNNNDISPFIAIAALTAVMAVMLGLNNQEFIRANWESLTTAIIKSQEALLFLAISFLLNVYVICMIAGRSLGYKKQGSKLRSIKKEEINFKNMLLRSTLSVLAGLLLYKTNLNYILENTVSLQVVLNSYYSKFVEVLSASTCLSYFLLVFWAIGVIAKILKYLKLDRRLPNFKRIENYLTLGSIGEEESNFDTGIIPRWALIPQKALNGNILVTGSIGTGKTQGTILNYVEQLFSNNFHLSPSALVLDPKGSFIPEVINILKKRKELGNCVYLGDAHGNI